VRRADERLIGACDLTLEQPLEGDLGYILAREAWGCGYATEAATLALDHGFGPFAMPHCVFTLMVRHSVENIDFETGKNGGCAAQHPEMESRIEMSRRQSLSSGAHGRPQSCAS
jgi:hypothetical protein